MPVNASYFKRIYDLRPRRKKPSSTTGARSSGSSTPAPDTRQPNNNVADVVVHSSSNEYTPDSLRGFSICLRCSHNVLVITEERRCVCTNCGAINDYAFETSGFLQKAMRDSYKRITHLNERISQWFMVEPPMPDPLYELFENAAFEPTFPNFEDFSKEDVRAVCKSIKVPPDLQEEYRSQKFKKKPLLNLNRFVEKWITLRWKLSGVRPATIDSNGLEQLRTLFNAIQMPFECVRHKPQCDGKIRKCHKVYKCRHNFINYNFTIIKLLRRILKDDELVDREYVPLFPQLKSKSKLRQLQQLWDKIIDYVGWDKVYPVVTAKQRLIQRLMQRKVIRK